MIQWLGCVRQLLTLNSEDPASSGYLYCRLILLRTGKLVIQASFITRARVQPRLPSQKLTPHIVIYAI